MNGGGLVVGVWVLLGIRCCCYEIGVLGLFELSEQAVTNNGRASSLGQAELRAAKLAVQHVNNAAILGRNFQLRLFVNDTKCDTGAGLDAFFHAVYSRREKMMVLLGTSCSDVTEALAKVVPYWNMVQVSFGSTSPALSDRREFPLFFRTIAPDSSHNPARAALLNKLSWATVAVFSQNEDIYSLGMNDLVTELEQANISCKAAVTFSQSEIRTQLQALKDLDTRIIIGSFSPRVAAKVFCEAYKLGMYGADYGWLLQGRAEDAWWEQSTDCTSYQVAIAVRGAIFITSYSNLIGTHQLSGLNRSELEPVLEGEGYSRESYDAVWAIALAISSATQQQDLTNFDYTSNHLAALLASNLETINFNGLSGPVSFNGPDRVGITAIYQIQDDGGVMVGLYDGMERELSLRCEGCKGLAWPGGHKPVAARIFKTRTVSVDSAAFILVALFAAVGLILAFSFLAINLHYSKHKLEYIKLSSPKLNNMAVVGCVLVYFAVILLGLDTASLPSTHIFPTVCTARVYLLSAGFSMAFGSMFAKTYRVHRIFTTSARGVVKNKLLQDTQLISVIFVLLVVDGLIVTAWVTVDPIERQLRNLTLEISPTERSIVYQPQIEVCSSEFIHSWLGVLYLYKGLLLAVGVYMAWETRHVKVAALNDSQYIGVSVYSTVITSVLVVVLANLVSERVSLAYLLIALPILTLTTLSLALLFFPKLTNILANADPTSIHDPIIHSMGLKIECNTRRFLADDRKELHFRVEVQNRVYRRELQLLDAEINKLERQLTMEASYSSSRSSLHAHKSEMDEGIERDRGKSGSIWGGMPMLVLPPVIPRASWPTEDSKRGVTFSSEPKLGEPTRASVSFPPTHQQPKKLSVLGRFLNILTPSVRKSSAPAGLASALRAHMEYFAGFVPGNNSGSLESSCNTSHAAINKAPYLKIYDFDIRERKYSLGFGGRVESLSERRGRQARSVQSLCQPRVWFSMEQEEAEGVTPRRRGSPRFPHRIIPTSSLGNLNHLLVATPGTKSKSLEEQGENQAPRRRGSPRFPHRILPTSSLGNLNHLLVASPDTKSSSLEEHVEDDSGSRESSPQCPHRITPTSSLGNLNHLHVATPDTNSNSLEEHIEDAAPRREGSPQCLDKIIPTSSLGNLNQHLVATPDTKSKSLEEQVDDEAQRRRGSPRFPHRIIPTSSLGNLNHFLIVTPDSKSKSLEETGQPATEGKRTASLSPNNELWFDNQHNS